jgi:putative acetyltransferase
VLPQIREERPGDEAAVAAVVEQAFGRPLEADLVAALRRDGTVALSLVAEAEGRVLGHILFSPVIIEGATEGFAAAGLAPLAVLPAFQRLGIGSALVSAGLRRCRELGFSRAVVMGDPHYYQRFGFSPAAAAGIRFPGDVPQEAFMAIALEPGALEGCAGTARYAPEFDAV